MPTLALRILHGQGPHLIFSWLRIASCHRLKYPKTKQANRESRQACWMLLGRSSPSRAMLGRNHHQGLRKYAGIQVVSSASRMSPCLLLGRDAPWNNPVCLDFWGHDYTRCSVLSRRNRAASSVTDASSWAVDKVLEQLLLLRLGNEEGWSCVALVQVVCRGEYVGSYF